MRIKQISCFRKAKNDATASEVLPRGFFILVSFFVSFNFLFLSCVGDVEEMFKNKVEKIVIKENIHIGHFTTKFKILDSLKWELSGTDAYYYNDQNVIKLSNIVVRYYDSEKGEESYVKSDFGVYYSKDKDIELISNVIIYSTNGREVRADYLKWNNVTEKLISKPGYKVTMIDKKNDSIISGYGFYADKKLESVVFSSNIIIEGEEEDIEEYENSK